MGKKNDIDYQAIRQLAELLNETDLSEIEVELDDFKVRVSRQVQAAVQVAAPQAAAIAPAPVATQPAATSDAPSGAKTADNPGVVPSPMVGTAYLAPEPGAAPFVNVGDTVREGQTIMIVEAMKTMNQIPAPRAGKITEMFVEDGHPVEYGEPLLVIE